MYIVRGHEKERKKRTMAQRLIWLVCIVNDHSFDEVVEVGQTLWLVAYTPELIACLIYQHDACCYLFFIYFFFKLQIIKKDNKKLLKNNFFCVFEWFVMFFPKNLK